MSEKVDLLKDGCPKICNRPFLRSVCDNPEQILMKKVILKKSFQVLDTMYFN